MLHAAVQAERLFARIRQTVAGQAVPATLKSAFLEPVGTRLPSELCVEMFGKADADFMGMFTGGWGCGAQLGRTDVWLLGWALGDIWALLVVH